VIGYETSEQLDVKPAQYFVEVTKREKRACKECEEQGVECAPAPVRIIEKGLARPRSGVEAFRSFHLQGIQKSWPMSWPHS
jgi:transposase